MKKAFITAFTTVLTVAPAVASAQQLGNLETLLRSIGRLVDIALPIVVALALLAFFWGLAMWLFKGAGDKAEGRSLMIWSIVALFVMVSVWGIVRFVGTAIGIQPGADQSIPVPNVQLR